MSDIGDDDQKRTANLARIRDNQRRSRARRKDYLAELEVKYRSCEETGAEASREIQQAARRVLDENKRLRQLLKQQGLSDTEIDGFLSDRPENPQYPSATTVALESMIGQRRPCRPGSGCESSSGSTSSRQQGVRSSLDVRATDPQQRLTAPPTLHPSPHHEDTSPRSASSSSVPTPGMTQFPILQPQPQQPFTSEPLPIMPSIDPNLGYDDSFMWNSEFFDAQASTSTEASSCYVAAEVIRTIKVGNSVF